MLVSALSDESLSDRHSFIGSATVDGLQAYMERATLDDKTLAAASRTWSILCISCRGIFKADLELGDNNNYSAKGPHHLTASGCQQAAEAGCSICHTVWQRATLYGDLDVLALNIPEVFSTFSIQCNSGSLHHHARWPEDCLVLSISIGSISRKRGMGITHMFAFDSVMFALQPASLHPTLLTCEVASESTSSEETWHLLEGWMAHCREDCKCLLELDTSFYLSRIIDVGATGDPQNKLCCRAQLDEKISYIALSHC